jgi:ribosome-binding protein aMBF1 (putative translation factor)
VPVFFSQLFYYISTRGCTITDESFQRGKRLTRNVRRSRSIRRRDDYEWQKNLRDVFEDIAHNNGYTNTHEYLRYVARKQGFDNPHQLIRAALSGFDAEKYSQLRILKEVESRLLTTRSPRLKSRLKKPQGVPKLNGKDSPLSRLKVTTYEDLSGVIRKRLNAIGANQSWLAREMNVSREAVSQYVRGETFPKRKRILSSLEKVLNVRIMRRDRPGNHSARHLGIIHARPHEVAGALRERMTELGKDALWLGRQLRVSQRTIQQYFRKEMVPRSKEVLTRLEAVLNIRVRKGGREEEGEQII